MRQISFLANAIMKRKKDHYRFLARIHGGDLEEPQELEFSPEAEKELDDIAEKMNKKFMLQRLRDGKSE